MEIKDNFWISLWKNDISHRDNKKKHQIIGTWT